MASSWRTKARIAAHVLLAFGFFDALRGRFMWRRGIDSAWFGDLPGPVPVDLRGAVHVHTCTYSDGLGTVEEVLAAASDAALDYVVLTDHNTVGALADDWPNRLPEGSPHLIVGSEITVLGGRFLLALGVPADFACETGLPAQAAVDRVRAAGGTAMVSLPFDMKHPWEDWDVEGLEGLEVLNLSTVARSHINVPSLIWLIPLWRRFGARAVLAAIAARPSAALRRWDRALASGKRWSAIGALDAHAQMKVGRRKVPLPTYVDSFRAATTHVQLERSSGQVRDAIGDALRSGQSYFSYDILADPTGFRFETDCGVRMGCEAPVGCVLRARSTPGTYLRLLRDGNVVGDACGGGLEYQATVPGAYRVEAYRVRRWLGVFGWMARPWIFSNPIYVTR